ncbi:MAG: lysophospholipid acyltransferase family protein [Candidatus Melainabacteria bacterium]|nr:lysophospholipid acyltransferase family protein [Candidatus Melainabacteria bacterium]
MGKEKKFRLRDVFLKYPLLDKFRVSGLANLMSIGVTMIDDSFRATAVISPGAKPFVIAVNQSRRPVPIANAPSCLFAYFHGQMVTLMALAPRSRMTTIASNSRDGEMIGRAADQMGFGTVRGSSTQGGMKAGRELVRESNDDRCILFNVDGPRGPRHVAKKSVIRVAELAGIPIVPVVCDGRKNLTVRSWDKYMIPWLHSRTVYIFGEPIFLKEDMNDDDREAARATLEERLRGMDSRLTDFWNVGIN